jgi:hypothetical protein
LSRGGGGRWKSPGTDGRRAVAMAQTLAGLHLILIEAETAKFVLSCILRRISGNGHLDGLSPTPRARQSRQRRGVANVGVWSPRRRLNRGECLLSLIDPRKRSGRSRPICAQIGRCRERHPSFKADIPESSPISDARSGAERRASARKVTRSENGQTGTSRSATFSLRPAMTLLFWKQRWHRSIGKS